MKTSQRGISFIAKEEGERLTAYNDIAGVPTISVGVTDGVTAEDVHNQRTITREESQAMFAMALASRESAVERLCTLKPNQNQFDAMVSLVYNIGKSGFAKSSVLKAHNSGDFQGAAKAFLLWNKSRVAGELQVIKGLSDRRARESELYLEPVVNTQQLTESRFARILKLIFTLFKRQT
jgi:lysozyme